METQKYSLMGKPSCNPTDNRGDPYLSTSRFHIFITILIVLLLVSAVSSLCIGRYHIGISQTLKILISELTNTSSGSSTRQESVIIVLRLPRVLASIMVGGALAISGSVYQGVFKNPLISPYVLGVSSGACVGAAIAIINGLNAIEIQVLAFLFGILTVFIATNITKFFNKNGLTLLVLSGIIVNGFMNAVMGIINYIADPETELPSIVYWQMGSFAKVTMISTFSVALPMIIATVIIIAMRWRINILSLGDSEAQNLGINVNISRGVMIICSTILTASAVCLCGTIGWVGLIIPHLGRMLGGVNNQRSIPITFILGAIFMVIIDTLARSITSLELPISILTGIVGTPFFLIILINQRGRLS